MTATPFAPSQVFIGGASHYFEVITKDGVLSQMVHVLDDHGEDSQRYITGITVRARTGDVYTVSTPNLITQPSPHDVDNFHDDSGLLVAVVRTAGELVLRKYDYSGHQVQEWSGLETDAGWLQESVKISLACDGTTVYYTDSKRTVFVYDLNTSTQMPPYDVLPDDTKLYGGIRVLPRGTTSTGHPTGLKIGPIIAVAMTASGEGPSRAVAIGNDKSIWTDDNLDTSVTVVKYKLSDGTIISGFVTKDQPGDGNGPTLALACYYTNCGVVGGERVWINDI